MKSLFIEMNAADLAKVKKRAQEMGLTMKAFVTLACARFIETGLTVDERIVALEARVATLEAKS